MRDVKAVLDRVDALRARLDAHRPLTPDVEERLEGWLTPRFLHCSAALGHKEALTATQVAAFLEREIVTGGHPLDRYLALRRHQAALSAARARAREGGQIDVDFVRRLHVLLNEGGRDAARTRPGLWKETPSRATRRRGHVFRHVAPSKVDECMTRLEQELGARLAEHHPLEAVAWLYFHLHMIQPFEKASGKVARLAATTVLLHRGYVPLIIAPDQLPAFLDALRAVDASVTKDKYQPLSPAFDLTPLIELFAGCVASTAERLLDLVEGRTVTVEGFSDVALASQQGLADELRRRPDTSWRFRATFEVRDLHARVVAVLEQLKVEGPLFTVALARQEVVPSHAVARSLVGALPTAEAGLIGQSEVTVIPQPTTRGIKFPAPTTLTIGVLATAYGMQLLASSSDLPEPQRHLGPSRSPEWPTSTLETILARTVDEQRKRFEGGIDRHNASPTAKFRLLKQRVGPGGEVGDALVVVDRGRAEAPAPASLRAQLEGGKSLEGVKPVEPPLSF